ncbi:MAG: hypothetical protein ACREQ8_14865 [Woeseiaceae bacterium]
MRLVTGLLLVILCVTSGRATDRTAWLSSLAGVPIQVFDLQAPDVSRDFRAFLSEIPMTNDRPVPGALVEDTVASLTFIKAATPAGEPSYFVASYIHKTPLVAASESARERYLKRYGEFVYPQQVCPVFLDRAGANVPTLLSTAVNLPASLFEEVTGLVDNYDRLFGLTEASHCGFIAHELAEPTVLPPALSRQELRTILEALGDFEATAVFRDAEYTGVTADEADVLFAARVLAMFMLERENAYTAIPGLVREYRRIGVDETHRQMNRISASVRLARRTVRSILKAEGVSVIRGQNALATIDARLRKAEASGELDTDDDLARALIADLRPALRLLQGDPGSVTYPRGTATSDPNRGGRGLITLTGASGTFLN